MGVKTSSYAEGKTFDFLAEDVIDPELLETFPYHGPKQRVCYKMVEFSAVCPFSGLPDYGIVWVKYVPQTALVELKSLKYYFQTFRRVGIFQEAVTARIFDDLYRLLQPQDLIIKTRYNTRGGIDTTCVIRSEDQES
ncbi:MAG: NADPH-dependent 7-cyano-7-deazaguanine reductase QueF [SAR324 cluster bacterium]|nr:NADPH-dependent 7-cyano-7-deazaguanine reductase QueF [SAR324 cluster bacterium]